MDTNQHMLASGQCDKNPQSCLNSMMSCVDFDDIDKYTKNLGNIMEEGNYHLNEMAEAVQEAADYLSDVDVSDGTADFYLTCNNSNPGIDACCKVNGKNLGGSCISSRLKLSLHTISNCNYPVVYENGNMKEPLCHRQFRSCDGYEMEIGAEERNKYTFSLYCFNSNSEYISNRPKLESGQLKPIGTKEVTLVRNGDDTCYCDNANTNINTNTNYCVCGNAASAVPLYNSKDMLPSQVLCSINFQDKLELFSRLGNALNVRVVSIKASKGSQKPLKGTNWCTYNNKGWIPADAHLIKYSEQNCGVAGFCIGQGESVGMFRQKAMPALYYQNSYAGLSCAQECLLCKKFAYIALVRGSFYVNDDEYFSCEKHLGMTQGCFVPTTLGNNIAQGCANMEIGGVLCGGTVYRCP